MKKAFIPMILIVIFGVVGGLTFAWYLSLQSGKFGNLTMIGKDQLMLIDVATSLESVLASLDMLASLSADAASDDAFFSGIPSSCGSFGGLPLYSDAKGICLPTDDQVAHDASLFFSERYARESTHIASAYDLVLPNSTFFVSFERDTLRFVSLPSGPITQTIVLGGGAR
jgi:hypothetical protein